MRWLPPEFGSRIARHRELGRQDDAVAPPFHQPAEDALGRAVRVVDGRVDEIAAAVDVGVEDAPGLGFVGAPAPVLAEGHRAQRQRRDAQAGAAQQAVLIECGHGDLLCG